MDFSTRSKSNRIDSSFRKTRFVFCETMEKIEHTTPTQASALAAKVAQITGLDRDGLGGGQAMRFLLRVAFWLSVVIILLPSAPEQKPSTHIGATDAISAASAAMADARQFCARQPGACEVGSHALTTFGQKAQSGAKMLYEFLSETFGPEKTGSVGSTHPSGKPSQHTLTPADLTPAWRGPQPVRDVSLKRPA